MDLKKLSDAATPKKLGAYLARRSKTASHQHGAGGRAQSIRTFEHAGHKVVVETKYKVTVDGKLLKAPLSVDAAGQVHCHSLPTYQTASALDMVRTIIDNFPEEFAKTPRAAKKPATKPTKARARSASKEHSASKSHSTPKSKSKSTRRT